MKAQLFSLCIFACTACAFDIDDALDRLDSTLTISGFQDNFRARLSGTVDLEFYNFQQPAPGLIDSNIEIFSIIVLRCFWTRKSARKCISLRKRNLIAGSIRATTAP